MELPLHVVTDEYSEQGWVVRIVDNKAVIQFEAIVGPNEDHTVIAARAEKIAEAVNCHDRLVDFLKQATSQFAILQDYAQKLLDSGEEEADLAAQSTINTFLTYKNFGQEILKELEGQ